MFVIFTRKSSKSGSSSAMMRKCLSVPNRSRINHEANHRGVIGEQDANHVGLVNLEISEKVEGVGQFLSLSSDIPEA